ncbi:MAG: hypothetical protein WBR18_14275 [Anaerolineales bacterium]
MKKRIVLAMGMHRSGTSLLAGLLERIGIDLGQNLVNADHNNESGYFENLPIVRIHRDLLIHMDRRLTGETGTLPYPEGWWQTPFAKSAAAELTDIVRRNLVRTNSIWGFKDPRVSRLLPLWNTIFEHEDLDPTLILSVRHPDAVAESLFRRDGLERAHAHLLWFTHNLEALSEARKRGVVVVTYDRWFKDLDRQTEQLAAALDGTGVSGSGHLLDAAREFVRKDLRHHTPDRPIANGLVRKAYELLTAAAIDGNIDDDLWSLVDEFLQGRDLFGPWSSFLEAHSAERQQIQDSTPDLSGSWPQRLRDSFSGLLRKA